MELFLLIIVGYSLLWYWFLGIFWISYTGIILFHGIFWMHNLKNHMLRIIWRLLQFWTCYTTLYIYVHGELTFRGGVWHKIACMESGSAFMTAFYVAFMSPSSWSMWALKRHLKNDPEKPNLPWNIML